GIVAFLDQGHSQIMMSNQVAAIQFQGVVEGGDCEVGLSPADQCQSQIIVSRRKLRLDLDHIAKGLDGGVQVSILLIGLSHGIAGFNSSGREPYGSRELAKRFLSAAGLPERKAQVIMRIRMIFRLLSGSRQRGYCPWDVALEPACRAKVI